MADRMRGLLEKVLAWWNKFTAKQKTIIISAGAGIVLTVAIIVVLLTRPQYTQLMTWHSWKVKGLHIQYPMMGCRLKYWNGRKHRHSFFWVPMISVPMHIRLIK